jgi:hypothetical protein
MDSAVAAVRYFHISGTAVMPANRKAPMAPIVVITKAIADSIIYYVVIIPLIIVYM